MTQRLLGHSFFGFVVLVTAAEASELLPGARRGRVQPFHQGRTVVRWCRTLARFLSGLAVVAAGAAAADRMVRAYGVMVLSEARVVPGYLMVEREVRVMARLVLQFVMAGLLGLLLFGHGGSPLALGLRAQYFWLSRLLLVLEVAVLRVERDQQFAVLLVQRG